VFVIGCVSCNKFSHFRQKNAHSRLRRYNRNVSPSKRRPPISTIYLYLSRTNETQQLKDGSAAPRGLDARHRLVGPRPHGALTVCEVRILPELSSPHTRRRRGGEGEEEEGKEKKRRGRRREREEKRRRKNHKNKTQPQTTRGASGWGRTDLRVAPSVCRHWFWCRARVPNVPSVLPSFPTSV
jgi:hypothetical protein